MVGVNSSIGIGVIGSNYVVSQNQGGSGGVAGYPENFVVEVDDQNNPIKEFVLSKPAKQVTVVLNRKPQIQTTPQVPNADFTHAQNTNLVTFSADVDLYEGDVVTITPYY